MSVTKHTCFLTTVMLVLIGATTVQAQLFKPFAFPPIESDYQFFATRDIDTLGGRPSYRTGWYTSYDRLYMSVSRPEFQLIDRANGQPPNILASNRLGDFAWGTQMELGFTEESRKGWGLRYFRLGGPHANENQLIERVTRFITPEDPEDDPERPPADDNNSDVGFRAYQVRNSINVGKLSSIEFNRTWLWKPLANGGTLEPFAGFRWVKFTNLIRRNQYTRYDENGLPIPPGDNSQANQDLAVAESLSQDNSVFSNSLVGGQLGIRWTKPNGRWNFAGDCRFFALENFQNYERVITREGTFYGDNDIDTIPEALTASRFTDSASRDEFCWGGEARAEAAFELTRDFALRVGFDWVWFGQGIGRGVTADDNNEDLMLYGVNFGVSLNR